MSFKLLLLLLVVFSISFFFSGCSGLENVRRENYSPESLKDLSEQRIKVMKDSSAYLKAHMKDGNLYVLRDWEMDKDRQNIIGSGILYDAYRNTIKAGELNLPVDSVAIFETNTLENSGTVTALTVYTGITAAITLYCLTNPKACFGSCPTFYINDSDSLRLQAEGFSSSISPSMEATDIDALYHAKYDCDEYSVEMRNEAMETHVIRSVNLLAAEKSKKSNRIFCSPDGKFFESDSFFSPYEAVGPEGSCFRQLQKADDKERFSKADSVYLGEKEFVELDFRNIPEGKYGLILGCRQTLLSTYLIYQTFAYMGKDAAHWIAEIERNKINVKGNEVLNMLGGIEVQYMDLEGNWQAQGTIDEYGPLAIDFHIIPLKNVLSKNAKIRLKMTKGYWRIDYASLASIKETEKINRLMPFEVLKGRVVDDTAKELLCDSSKVLVTLPGDTYGLKYRLPSGNKDYELFLESRGYYLEWMRKEWLQEEDRQRLAELFLNPESALRRLAPEFKAAEPKMESSFWRSRYAKP